MAEKRLENSKVRYSAAYPTGAERVRKGLLYHGVPIVLQGADTAPHGQGPGGAGGGLGCALHVRWDRRFVGVR